MAPSNHNHINNQQRHSSSTQPPPPGRPGAAPPAHTNTQREAIVDKLHGALATFRRERDEVHRAKELAVERLRLAREEREAAERTVQSMQEKYDRLIKSVSSSSKSNSNSNDDEIAKLQAEVERLSREARFQHGELVSKREKMNQLKSSMEEEQTKRSGYLRLARDAVRKRREKVALREAKEENNCIGNTMEESIRKVLQSSSSSGGDEQELYSKLQRLIEKNAADVASEIESIAQKSNLTSRRIAGYTKFINGEGLGDGNALVHARVNVDNGMNEFGIKQ